MYIYNKVSEELNYTKLESAYDTATLNPYMSWLEYKRIHHIVRYYPTFNMYVRYRYYCHIHNFTPYGAETNEHEAFKNLLRDLRERIA